MRGWTEAHRPEFLRRAYGPAGLLPVRLTAAAARACGFVVPDHGTLRLTPRGYDVFHDLERQVTYRLIEPLWAQLLREHDERAAAAPDEGRSVSWAAPDRGRRGAAWWLARRLTERPVPTSTWTGREGD